MESTVLSYVILFTGIVSLYSLLQELLFVGRRKRVYQFLLPRIKMLSLFGAVSVLLCAIFFWITQSFFSIFFAGMVSVFILRIVSAYTYEEAQKKYLEDAILFFSNLNFLLESGITFVDAFIKIIDKKKPNPLIINLKKSMEAFKSGRSLKNSIYTKGLYKIHPLLGSLFEEIFISYSHGFPLVPLISDGVMHLRWHVRIHAKRLQIMKTLIFQIFIAGSLPWIFMAAYRCVEPDMILHFFSSLSSQYIFCLCLCVEWLGGWFIWKKLQY